MKKYKIKQYTNECGSIIYYSYMYTGTVLIDFIVDSIHMCNRRIFSFLGSFFILLLLYNCGSLIPHVEEITKDLNVCLAFALYGFFYIQYIAIKETGFNYLNHWVVVLLRPKNMTSRVMYYIHFLIIILINSVASVIMFPFTILEKVSLLFSLTFRLFGNIFGGSIVVALLRKVQMASILYYAGTTMFGIQLLVLFYFGFFEGVIQAFVFTLILLNSIGTLINKEH